MNKPRKLLSFCLSSLLLLTISCASSTNNSDSQLISIEKINDPETAKKALIVAQDVRLTVMRSVKKSVELGVRPSSDIEKFKEIDNKVRPLWDQAFVIVDKWTLHNNGKQSFIDVYSELFNLLIQLQNLRDCKQWLKINLKSLMPNVNYFYL